MGTTLKVNLSLDSIRNAIKELNNYKQDLNEKQQYFVERLLEKGIEVAREHSQDVGGLHGTHHMGKYVTFKKSIEAEGSNCKGILLGMGDEVFSNISKGRSINALYALEFGTAALGIPPYKGTNSVSGHANDLIWYVWIEDGIQRPNGKTGNYKLLSAISPTRPMYEAGMKMVQDIREVAQEVFHTDRTISC